MGAIEKHRRGVTSTVLTLLFWGLVVFTIKYLFREGEIMMR